MGKRSDSLKSLLPKMLPWGCWGWFTLEQPATVGSEFQRVLKHFVIRDICRELFFIDKSKVGRKSDQL